MKKLLLAVLVTATLASCGRKSAIKHERGVVVEKQYVPEFDADGTGMTSNGDVVWTHSHEDHKFLLVFKCEHGNIFTINQEELYANLEKGDSVDIAYREVFYFAQDTVRNKPDDFDFITATKVEVTDSINH